MMYVSAISKKYIFLTLFFHQGYQQNGESSNLRNYETVSETVLK